MRSFLYSSDFSAVFLALSFGVIGRIFFFVNDPLIIAIIATDEQIIVKKYFFFSSPC